MMQTTQPWHRCHLVTDAGSFPCFTTRRRSLFQREMCAILEIVEDVFVHQAFQMPPIENDHMVEQIPATGASPAFRNAVLPWTSEARLLWADTEALHGFGHFTIELRAAIKNQVAGSRVIWERLAQLLNDPCTRRMASHLTLKNTPPVMRDDEKAAEHSEGQRRDGKEIHRGDGFPMIGEKGRPSLGRLRTPRRSPHPAQHVGSETSKPSIFNSPWMRGAPHVEFSATIRKISSRNSLLTHFLPARTRRRESHVQYSLNPARCQRTTVSGWTRINACIHSGQNRRKITQNSLPDVETCARGYRCFRTTSCWLSTKFSSSRSRRERKMRIWKSTKYLSRHSMKSVSCRGGPSWDLYGSSLI